MIYFVLGLIDDSSPPETQGEESDAQITTPAQDAFVQDSLDAHEEFLESQSTQEQESSAGEMQESEEAEDTEQPDLSSGDQFVEDETEKEEPDRSLRLEEEPLVTAGSLETDVALPAHGPGPLVTEVEDAEELETIFLTLKGSLRTDDLPDLEDVDTEHPPDIFCSHQVLTPNIGVVSGSTDEDEPSDYQSEDIPAFGSDEDPLFIQSGCLKPKVVLSKPTSLLYPEDKDALELEPHIFGAAGKLKPVIAPSRPCCLIEEIDESI